MFFRNSRLGLVWAITSTGVLVATVGVAVLIEKWGGMGDGEGEKWEREGVE